MLRVIAIATLLSLSLSACTSPSGEFPTLMRRPYETQAPITAGLTVAEAAPIALPAETQAKVDAFSARHRLAASAYGNMLPAVAAAARSAAGSTFGGEAWVNAHLQVSRLDKARSDSKAALAELDQLITAQMDMEAGGTSPMLSPLMSAVQNDLAAATSAQDAEIERLSQLIGI
jgi:hypothetical protein